MHASSLGWIAGLSAVVGLNLFAMDVRPKLPKPVLCDFVLLPQTIPGGCASFVNPVCGGVGGPTCCSHYHNSLTYNQAVHWVKPTGQTKGPPIKKYFQAHDETCSGSLCVASQTGTDYQHYAWEDTLMGCAP